MPFSRRNRTLIAARAAVASVAASIAFGAGAADPVFQSTSDPTAWEVATTVGGVDGAFTSFPTTGFAPAVAITGRSSEGVGWIANNASGSNACCVGNWTFFVFRQTFDLTGFDASTASLSFRWAADDSGEGFADRGSWRPKFRLNGGDLVAGQWATGATYDLGLTTTLTGGFVAGENTLEFFVEGNGVTDGFALQTVAFTAAVPEPETWALWLAGLGVMTGVLRRRSRAD